MNLKNVFSYHQFTIIKILELYELGQIDLENISDLNVINNPVISI